MEMQGLEVKLAEKHIRDANEELTEKVKGLDAAKKTIATKEGVLNHKKEELEKIDDESLSPKNRLKKKHLIRLSVLLARMRVSDSQNLKEMCTCTKSLRLYVHKGLQFLKVKQEI